MKDTLRAPQPAGAGQGTKRTAGRYFALGLALVLAAAAVLLVLRPGLRGPGTEEAAAAILTEYQQLLGQERSLTDPVLNVLQTGFEVQIEQMGKPAKKGMDVQCTVRNYDAAAAAAQMQQECGGWAFSTGTDYRRVLAQTLLQQEKHTAEAVIRLEPDGHGGWRARFSQEALNRATGGLVALLAGEAKKQ